MSTRSRPGPPDGIADAILEAARVAGIGVAVTSRRGGNVEPLWFNEAAVEILQRPLDELLRSDVFALLAPEHRAPARDSEQARVRGERSHDSFSAEAITPSGARVPVHATLGFTMRDDRRLAITFFRDVSAERAAEQALRESEARFRSLVESAPDAIAIQRADGVVVYANSAAARVLGFASPEAMVGVHTLDLYAPAEHPRLRLILERILKTGEPVVASEYRLRRRDGTIVVLEMTGMRIEYDGAPAVLGLGRDVSERHRMQEQLARADRLAALGTLAAGVAHEINNPLTFVSLGLQALERRLSVLELDKAAREQLAELLVPMRAGADRVAAIVGDLRAFARTHDEKSGPIVVEHAVDAAVRMAAHELRQRARLERCIEGSPRALGHSGRLEQVLLNLIVNSLQAFPEQATDPRVEIACAQRGEWIQLAVEDNAGGIPEEHRARVFEPFFTTKPPEVGTGLGLWICHELVRAMRGTIVLESEVGRGTTVRIRLPAFTGEPDGEAAVERPRSDRAPRLRVLVVDDEPSLGRLIQHLIGDEHDVEAVLSAEAALDRIASGAPIDVVLCDVVMPRLGGPELREKVRATWPELAARFVFMTGGALTARNHEYLAATPERLLHKPFTSEALRAAIREAGARDDAAGSVRTSRS